MTHEFSRHGKVEFYKDRKGLWRWRAKASNGKILADSGQGYSRKLWAAMGMISASWAIHDDRTFEEHFGGDVMRIARFLKKRRAKR